MEKRIVSYGRLPEEAVRIRKEVFMQEQGFQEEFDEIDGHAFHLVLFCDGDPAAVLRFWKVRPEDGWGIGRLAVRKEYRGKGLGAELLAAAGEEIRKAGGEQCACTHRDRRSPFMKSRAMPLMEKRILTRGVLMCG